MKKIIALILALVMVAALFVACNETPAEDGATTTTTTTTKKTTTTPEKPDEPEEPDPDPETPITGEDWTAWHESMQTVPGLEAAADIPTVWGDGTVTNVFDGIDGYYNKNEEGKGTKLGGGDINSGVVNLTFEAPNSKLIAYTLITGGDSGDYPGRTCNEWTLYGWDETASDWVVIDYVYDGAMQDVNATPFGYTIDEDKQATYSSYKFEFAFGVDYPLTVLQLDEIYLYVAK